MLGWIKAQWFRFVTNGAFYSENMSIAQWRRRHSRVLVRQILSSLKLQPVSLAVEIAGACVTAMFFGYCLLVSIFTEPSTLIDDSGPIDTVTPVSTFG